MHSGRGGALSSTSHCQINSMSILSSRLAAPCVSRGPLPERSHSECPQVILLLPQGYPRQSLPSSGPPKPKSKKPAVFMTQTCIRFIHKTAWFPKTIQTACSSAGSWPWARGPRPKGTPLSTHPHWQGTTQRSPFLLPSARLGKKDSFSLREVAMIMIRTIETWASRSQ